MLFSLSLGFAPAPLPTLTGDYCADVTETLIIDGSAPQPGRAFTLCVDNTNIRWNQKAAGGKTWQIFNGTNFWSLEENPNAPGGWTCKTKRSGPESRDLMPYRITTLDPGTVPLARLEFRASA